MIKISLEDINLKSPYEITLNNGDFDFTTDNGTRYSVTSSKMYLLVDATPINSAFANEKIVIQDMILK